MKIKKRQLKKDLSKLTDHELAHLSLIIPSGKFKLAIEREVIRRGNEALNTNGNAFLVTVSEEGVTYEVCPGE